jgi:16S rRNA (uracil1498-N3)-methyltransferase
VRTPRIYTPETLAAGARVVLTGSGAHHLARVLRAQPGATVTLFNGDGYEYAGRIASITREAVDVAIESQRTPVRESTREVVLVQGVSRGERMDYAIQKAVELGVTAIVPVLTERSVVRLDGERAQKRRTHWLSVAISACEQAGRLRVPSIAQPQALSSWLGVGALAAGDSGLVLDPAADRGIAELPAPRGRVVLAIGPEGGLSTAEIGQFDRAGFTGMRLGPRILRTETAAVAALSAVQLLWGDMGS